MVYVMDGFAARFKKRIVHLAVMRMGFLDVRVAEGEGIHQNMSNVAQFL